MSQLANIVKTFVVGMDHSQPVQKDHYIITLLEVGFHPGFYHESFVVLCMVQSSRPAGVGGTLGSAGDIATKCLSMCDIFFWR